MPTKKKIFVITVSRCFMSGHPKEGHPTNFLQKILTGFKIHTIRGNYDLWKKRIDDVNSGKAVLSLRYWTGKPYNSKQEEFLELSAAGIQRFETDELGVHSIDGRYSDHDITEIAANDGLLETDFRSWFNFKKPFNGGIIHFTDFRYN